MKQQKKSKKQIAATWIFRAGLVLTFLTGFNIFCSPSTPEINMQLVGLVILVGGCLLPFIGHTLYKA